MWQNIFKPEYQNWRLVGSALLSIYVRFFVIVFQPLRGDKLSYIWTSAFDLGLHITLNFLNVFLITVLFVVILPKYFTEYYHPEKINVKKLAQIFTVAAIIISNNSFFINYYFFHFELSLVWYASYLSYFVLSNLLMSSFPACLCYLLIFRKLTQSKSNLGTENTSSNFEKRTPQYNAVFAPNILAFTDGSNKKVLQLPIDRLYYIASAQNNIEIHYQNKNDERTHIVIRNSLKTIETEMIDTAQYPLMRCHKGFIVNRQKIKTMRGPSKMAEFVLDDDVTFIPVSRQKFSELKPLFPSTSMLS
jgi:hypothetical protein